MFELLLETVPELLLELYMMAYKYHIVHRGTTAPDPLYIAAVSVGVLSLSSGAATAYTCEENLKMKIAVAVYIGTMCIARFTTHVALFVDLGDAAVAPCVVFLLMRCGWVLHRYNHYFNRHLGGAAWDVLLPFAGPENRLCALPPNPPHNPLFSIPSECGPGGHLP